METEASRIPLEADIDKDNRLAQVIGKLIQTASFIEYWIEMNILGRVPEGSELFVKALL